MNATIMMVTYNRLDLTKRTFETTLKNAGMKYDLVIIDNNSSDDTVNWLGEHLNELGVNYKVVRLNKNMGIAYGRNMGLKVGDSFMNDYLCCLDNDVILGAGWLRDCVDVLMYNKNIGACGVNLEGVKYPLAKVKCGDRVIDIQIKPRGNLGTAAMVFRKDVHEKIGFFINYECYGHEDAIYGFLIRKLGKNLAYLGEMGDHIGVGNNDGGEYREMKNKYWDINIKKFEKDIREYANGIRKLYTKFENYDPGLEIGLIESIKSY